LQLLVLLVKIAPEDEAADDVLVDGEGSTVHGVQGSASRRTKRRLATGYYWLDVVVCDVVVELLAGATGDIGEEVVDSSVVVVVELGMELSSLAQPASALRATTVREERSRFFMV
jgi:hypothetical protein